MLAFYNARRRQAASVAPNAAHVALARLQTAWARAGGKVTLCTQNVDSLLEAAGAQEVLHMHGVLNKTLCGACGERFACAEDILINARCPSCDVAGGLRPDVVWFGEYPYHLDVLAERLGAADLFVSIGTSGAVYPAAGFVRQARAHGALTLEINLDPSENAEAFDDCRLGAASKAVPAWVEEMLALM